MKKLKDDWRQLCGKATFIAVALTVATPAFAQTDPPTRVGRVSLIQNGGVSFRPAPDAPWQEAVVNYPVAQSMSLWSDDNARAEIEIGEARLRLAPQTELDVVRLDDNNVVLSVPMGRIDVTLRNKWADENYRVQAPSGEIELTDNGAYRIIAGTNRQPTRLSAFNSDGRINGASGALTLRPGDEAIVQPNDLSGYDIEHVSEDEFDRWSASRDRDELARAVPQYVPPYPGTEALANYGVWRNVPEYGYVWIPSDVGDGWAPYREGHWAWIDPWGWTWVDDAPWGFAPFHYGRWAMIDGAWGWIPVDAEFGGSGRFTPRYAPALVTFLGDPGQLGISLDGGVVGWVALGPHEPWYPWYHSSDRYMRDINAVNLRRGASYGDRHNFTNQRFSTVVPRDSFAQGRSVGRDAIRVPQGAFDRPIQAGKSVENFLPSREAFDDRHKAAFTPTPYADRPHPNFGQRQSFASPGSPQSMPNGQERRDFDRGMPRDPALRQPPQAVQPVAPAFDGRPNNSDHRGFDPNQRRNDGGGNQGFLQQQDQRIGNRPAPQSSPQPTPQLSQPQVAPQAPRQPVPQPSQTIRPPQPAPQPVQARPPQVIRRDEALKRENGQEQGH